MSGYSGFEPAEEDMVLQSWEMMCPVCGVIFNKANGCDFHD